MAIETMMNSHTATHRHSVYSVQLLSHASLTQQPQQGSATVVWNTETCSCLVFQIPQRAHTCTNTDTHCTHFLFLTYIFASSWGFFSPASFHLFLSLSSAHCYIFIPAWQSVPTSSVFFLSCSFCMSYTQQFTIPFVSLRILGYVVEGMPKGCR